MDPVFMPKLNLGGILQRASGSQFSRNQDNSRPGFQAKAANNPWHVESLLECPCVSAFAHNKGSQPLVPVRQPSPSQAPAPSSHLFTRALAWQRHKVPADNGFKPAWEVRLLIHILTGRTLHVQYSKSTPRQRCL